MADGARGESAEDRSGRLALQEENLRQGIGVLVGLTSARQCKRAARQCQRAAGQYERARRPAPAPCPGAQKTGKKNGADSRSAPQVFRSDNGSVENVHVEYAESGVSRIPRTFPGPIAVANAVTVLVQVQRINVNVIAQVAVKPLVPGTDLR